LDVTTAAAVGVHPVGASFFSANKILNYVGSHPLGWKRSGLNALILISQAIANGIGGKLESSSAVAKAAAQKDVDNQSAQGGKYSAEKSGEKESDPTALLYGMSAAKAVISVANYAMQFGNSYKPPNYGYNLTSGQNSTSTTMWANPSTTQLVLFALLTLGSDVGKIGTDIGESIMLQKELDSGEMKDSAGNTLTLKANTDSKYMEDAKNYANYRPGARVVSDLLPEVVAMILLNKQRGRQKNHALGGVLVNAPDANINMVAKNAIGLHSQHGILLNTNMVGKMKPKILRNYGGEDWNTWGLAEESIAPGISKERMKKLFNFYHPDAVSYTISKDCSKDEIQNDGVDFLAAVSTYHYTDVKYLVANVDEVHKSVARKHILASCPSSSGVADGVGAPGDALVDDAPGDAPVDDAPGDALVDAPDYALVDAPNETRKTFGNSVVIQEADTCDLDDLQAPSKASGIFLTSREGSISSQASDKKRSLILGDKGLLLAANADDLEKPHVFLSDDAVHVKIGDSVVQIKNGEINLNAKKDGESALIHLSKGRVGIYSSKKAAAFDNIEFNGDKLKGVSDISKGAIKILGPQTPGTAPAPAVTAPTLAEDKRTLA
jgi:hypothetical protein